MPKTSSINPAVYTEYCKFVLVMTVNFGFIPHLLTSLTLLHFIYPAVQNTNAMCTICNLQQSGGTARQEVH